MGYVERKWGVSDWEIVPYKTDMKCFKIVKSRSENTCKQCKKTIPSKSYMYSSDYIKFCLICGEAFSHKAVKGYEKIIKYIKDNQKILEKNRDKWEAQNTIVLL